MHSKWADACSQALAFDQVANHTSDLRDEDFCKHLVSAGQPRVLSRLRSLENAPPPQP